MVNRCGFAETCLECPLDYCFYDKAKSEYKAKYYVEHKAEIQVKIKKWKSENPEKQREYNKRYAMTHDRTAYFKERYRRLKANAMVNT